MVDCHWRFDEPRAAMLIRDLVRRRRIGSSAPSPSILVFSAIARLTRLAREFGMQTAGGEMIAGADQAEAMCAAGLYDVLMPDIKYAGGYRGMLEIAGFASGMARRIPRTIRRVPIAHLASIICAPPRRRSCGWSTNGTKARCSIRWSAGVRRRSSTGRSSCPDTPGLGAALDRELAAAHPWQPLPASANLDERLG
jgi:galactonate dehydratase